MKNILILSLFAGCAGFAIGQEPLPPDQLDKIAPRLAERASDQRDTPFKLEVTAGAAFGMKIKDYGVVVLPAKNLTKESLAKLDATVVPIGQLWMSRLVPFVGGKRVAADQLRPILMATEREETTLQLLFLGVRKKEGAEPELLIFGLGKEPVATLPLKKAERSQETPLELDLRKGSESLGVVDLRIVGQYETSLSVDDAQP